MKKEKKNQKNINFKKDPFIVIDSMMELARFFRFKKKIKIIEDDLDEIRFIEDINNRRKLDAEILSLIAANVPIGNMLDIGTYHGHSAARMAINSPQSTIFTVNIHPEELSQAGERITGTPSLEEIGIFFRGKDINNIYQIFANTKTWNVPKEIDNLSLVYVDGCHDRSFVYNDTKLVIHRVIKDGFILWHDCSPIYRNNFEWINESMSGIEMLVEEQIIDSYILNVKNSWIGIWRKNA